MVHSHSSQLNQIGISLTPKGLESYLDRYIVSQRDAKRMLATKLATHLARINYEQGLPQDDDEKLLAEEKPNMLFIGPTGTGKTRMITLALERTGLPYILGDATKFTASGYIGDKVENLVKRLYFRSGKNKLAAERGVIYIDEVDKIAAAHSFGRDIGGKQVQDGLLALMQGSRVRLGESSAMVTEGEVEIDTSRILFIMSGAFQGLDKIQADRRRRSIGFGNVRLKEDSPIELDDLVTFGMDSQLLGRIPNMVKLQQLDEKDLYHILALDKNPLLRAKQREFAAFGVTLQFLDSAYKAMAHQAAIYNKGARSLKSIVERVLEPFQYELPEHTDCPPLVVDGSTVENPQDFLNEFVASFKGKKRRAIVASSFSSAVTLGSGSGQIDLETEGEVPDPLELFEQRFKNYRVSLYNETALPRSYIDAAANYGLKMGKEVAEVVDDIEGMQREFHIFVKDYRKNAGISIRFRPAYRNAVIGQVLQELREVKDILTGEIKPLLDFFLAKPGAIEKYAGRDLWISEKAYYDPKGFFERL